MEGPGTGPRYSTWPRPEQIPSEARLLETIDEYERRAVAIGLPSNERDRSAFMAYRSLAICARGWLEELIRARPKRVPAITASGPSARPCLLRQALDALSGKDG